MEKVPAVLRFFSFLLYSSEPQSKTSIFYEALFIEESSNRLAREQNIKRKEKKTAVTNELKVTGRPPGESWRVSVSFANFIADFDGRLLPPVVGFH